MDSWRHLLKRLVLLMTLASPLVMGDGGQSSGDISRPENLIDRVAGDDSYIDSLLVDREFPLIGGRWGWEMFVDAPLNGEPEGAEITLRRAKLKYLRNFGNNWRLKLTADYNSGGDLEISDNNIIYSGWKRGLLTLGISDPAFSLESVSQSTGLTFMERGMPVAALAESKSGGVSYLLRGTHSILNTSLILFNVSQDNLREDGQGVVFHYVYSPVEFGESQSIHVGGSFSHRVNTSEDNTRFRTRPEVATINDYYVDTGSISGADQVSRLSVEASQVIGRFSWQAELMSARVSRSGADHLTFRGGYAFASWFLTADSRRYNFGDGSYAKVRVGSPVFGGGAGAFELALRVSHIDLSDGDVLGGKEKNLTIGLNWYLNQRIRLMMNLVKVIDVDRPGSEYDGLDPLILSLRAQWVLN